MSAAALVSIGMTPYITFPCLHLSIKVGFAFNCHNYILSSTSSYKIEHQFFNRPKAQYGQGKIRLL